MSEHERKQLAEAVIPFKALCIAMQQQAFREISPELQKEMLKSMVSIEHLLFMSQLERKLHAGANKGIRTKLVSGNC